MPQPAYLSEVRIEHHAGAIGHAHLPSEEQPETFGLHGAVADHYRLEPDSYEPRASTLDHLVSAAGGCLLSSFAGALERRGVELGSSDIVAEALGHVEKDGSTLVLRRIHVHFHLEVGEEHRAIVDQVHECFTGHCPVYRSLTPSIQITTSYEIVEAEASGEATTQPPAGEEKSAEAQAQAAA